MENGDAATPGLDAYKADHMTLAVVGYAPGFAVYAHRCMYTTPLRTYHMAVRASRSLLISVALLKIRLIT